MQPTADTVAPPAPKTLPKRSVREVRAEVLLPMIEKGVPLREACKTANIKYDDAWRAVAHLPQVRETIRPRAKRP
jgi:molybdenum-dependent DNA-binding transcriptional regulator ModE